MAFISASALVKCLFALVALLHILACPFTKVEESFNLQAIHDVIFLQTDVSNYDHNMFPGVVPRTFIGPLMVSLITLPLVNLAPASNLFIVQIISNMLRVFVLVQYHLNLKITKKNIFYKGRIILAAFVISGVFSFTSAIKKVFNSSVEKWTLILLLTQFHFMFYISRTLPNTFGLIFCIILLFI